MYSKEEAYAKIAELTDRFSFQIDNYKRGDYNETQTRRDFIDPFFEALGWDMNNKQGAWEAYREVIHEDKLKVGGVTTAPDYSFRLTGGQRLFFVEAKKPSIIIKDDVAPAYQVRLYGWNAKLAISVVTDFEEFAVYECSKKPLKTDKASKARVNYYTYKDYLKEFDFFWNTFSREQVIKGGLVKFQQADKKGTATVDKDFLESLDVWRKELASNIYKNNEGINEDELNYAVQQTIDRIIFLRIAEDRGLEPYGQLKSSLQNAEQYKELYRQFRIADDKYNSGLFHFKKEKDNGKEPDNISGKLIIDNKVIKSIISSLYPPQSEFLFNVMPVEILGSAYEQFLGKQIIVKGSRASIEEKPEVRKAGGVYYTPQYIVEYIVENTVGKLCQDKTPKDISRLKIVDPACGSGSFLLGAYQYLLNWHSNYYTNNPQKGKQKDAVLTPDGSLTTAEKKRILLNNIYGVDIDRNATEVTKLSLLLKCMEGETTASVNTQMTFFHERILPSLENNIKSGNSLIDVDFYDTEFDFGEEKKIKPFNWQQGFPEVFKQGGFDCVVGNPPYIQSREGQLNELEKNYYNKNYKTTEYQINTFGLFSERGINILKEKGLLGFIIPNYWLSTKYDKQLRSFLFQENHTLELINVYRVFESATVDTLLLLVRKENIRSKIIQIKSIDRNIKTIQERLQALHESKWSFNDSIDLKKDDGDLQISFRKEFKLIAENKIKNYFILKFGAKLYEVGKGTPKQNANASTEKIYESNRQIDKSYKRLLRARCVQRYKLLWDNYWVKYGGNLAAPRNPEIFLGTRILLQRIVSKNLLDALLIDQDYVCNTDVITLKPLNKDIDCNFFLAIINSTLCMHYIRSNNINVDRKAFPKINTNTLEEFPVPNIDKINFNVKKELTTLVDTMIILNKEKQQTTTPDKLDQLNARIQYTDDKINKLVYTLYGLSEEEVGIVEGKF